MAPVFSTQCRREVVSYMGMCMCLNVTCGDDTHDAATIAHGKGISCHEANGMSQERGEIVRENLDAPALLSFAV